MSKPLIGITAYDYVKPENGWHYDISYSKNAAAIERAGGLPVLIPASLSQETLRAIYERLDAVLLPGGGDVNPATRTVTLMPGQRKQIALRMDDEFRGKFRVKAINPTTLALASKGSELALETDYTE